MDCLTDMSLLPIFEVLRLVTIFERLLSGFPLSCSLAPIAMVLALLMILGLVECYRLFFLKNVCLGTGSLFLFSLYGYSLGEWHSCL